MSRIDSTERFEPRFFSEFTGIANRITSRDDACRYRLPEALEANQAFFAPDSPFSRHNRWRAFLARDEGGNVVGRLVASRNPEHRDVPFVPVGFFECLNDADAAAALFAAGEDFAREVGVHEIRGPMNGNFFNSYRLRLPSATAPFHGEPIHPAYYLNLFERSGFRRAYHWRTVRLPWAKAFARYSPITRQLFSKSRRKRANGPRLTVRHLDRSRWDEEVRAVYGLMQASFSSIHNFTPISFDEARARLEAFKDLLEERMVFFIEQDGKPIAFLISYHDPLPIQLWSRRTRLPFRVRDAVSRIWKRLPLRREMLVPYLGKLPEADGIRGATALMAAELFKTSLTYAATSALFCFIIDGSPSLGVIPKDLEVVAEYVLYSKALEPRGAQ
jgi:hypothetical protein